MKHDAKTKRPTARRVLKLARLLGPVMNRRAVGAVRAGISPAKLISRLAAERAAAR